MIDLITQAKQTGDDGLSARLAEIDAMPEAERGEALRMLGQDYKGQRDMLNRSMDFNESQLQAASPESRVAGPSSNPFAIEVAANPLEHIASGMGKYKAGTDIRSDRESLGKLSDEWTTQNTATMNSYAKQAAEAEALRKLQEEEEKRNRDIWNT